MWSRRRRLSSHAVPPTPIVTLVHSMGTVLGVVDPPEDFRVTEKTTDSSGDADVTHSRPPQTSFSGSSTVRSSSTVT